jgi:hypothetical protein
MRFLEYPAIPPPVYVVSARRDPVVPAYGPANAVQRNVPLRAGMAPPVYRPQSAGMAQLKPAAHAAARPPHMSAPPVYRPSGGVGGQATVRGGALQVKAPLEGRSTKDAAAYPMQMSAVAQRTMDGRTQRQQAGASRVVPRPAAMTPAGSLAAHRALAAKPVAVGSTFGGSPAQNVPMQPAVWMRPGVAQRIPARVDSRLGRGVIQRLIGAGGQENVGRWVVAKDSMVAQIVRAERATYMDGKKRQDVPWLYELEFQNGGRGFAHESDAYYWLLEPEKVKEYLINPPKAGYLIPMRSSVLQTDEETLKFRVSVGLVYDASAKPMNCGKVSFVIDANGVLLLGTQHTGLSKGRSVTMAGEMSIHEGRARYESRQTGHYYTTVEEQTKGLAYMKQHFAWIGNLDVVEVRKPLAELFAPTPSTSSVDFMTPARRPVMAPSLSVSSNRMPTMLDSSSSSSSSSTRVTPPAHRPVMSPTPSVSSNRMPTMLGSSSSSSSSSTRVTPMGSSWPFGSAPFLQSTVIARPVSARERAKMDRMVDARLSLDPRMNRLEEEEIWNSIL